MSQQISLKQAERKVLQSAFQDGLSDILIGCIVLLFAIAPLLSASLGDFWSSMVFLPFWALVYLAIWLTRKYVVMPRVGVVKLGIAHKTRLTKFAIAMFAVNVFALVLGIFSTQSFGAVPGWIHVIAFGLIVMFGFSLAAYFLDFTRLYAYGVMIPLSFLIGEWLYQSWKVPHHGFPITFGVTAAAMISVGLIQFVRLVHEHPIPPEQRASEGA